MVTHGAADGWGLRMALRGNGRRFPGLPEFLRERPNSREEARTPTKACWTPADETGVSFYLTNMSRADAEISPASTLTKYTPDAALSPPTAAPLHFTR